MEQELIQVELRILENGKEKGTNMSSVSKKQLEEIEHILMKTPPEICGECGREIEGAEEKK